MKRHIYEWLYEPDEVYATKEWLHLYFNGIKVAQFSLERNEQQGIEVKRVSLRVNLGMLSLTEVFRQLALSNVVSRDDKVRIKKARPKLYEFHGIDLLFGTQMTQYLYFSNKAEARRLNEYFQTPAGQEVVHLARTGVEFDYISPADIITGDIKVQ